MRHTRLSRFLTAMFGIWFTFTLLQPTGMIGMTMSGDSASMMVMSDGMMMAGMDMSTMDMSNAGMANMDMSQHQNMQKAEQGAPQQSSAPPECDQHDCCCSAVPLSMLAPVATLAWLPDFVINQDTPQYGEIVAHTDGQLLLPFANGPPSTVSA